MSANSFAALLSCSSSLFWLKLNSLANYSVCVWEGLCWFDIYRISTYIVDYLRSCQGSAICALNFSVPKIAWNCGSFCKTNTDHERCRTTSNIWMNLVRFAQCISIFRCCPPMYLKTFARAIATTILALSSESHDAIFVAHNVPKHSYMFPHYTALVFSLVSVSSICPGVSNPFLFLYSPTLQEGSNLSVSPNYFGSDHALRHLLVKSEADQLPVDCLQWRKVVFIPAVCTAS